MNYRQKTRRQTQTDLQELLVRLPRREFISLEPTEISPPPIHTATFATGRIMVFARVVLWLLAGASVLAGNIWDALRGRNSETRSAARLRRAFEKRGGTFRKVGQLMSMQIDLLPWAYCVELSKILDPVDPMPLATAVTLIEAAAGKPLADVFKHMDPEPIGSSTFFCVYQAERLDGQKVALKVRRPGVGERLMADLKALEWILDRGESLSLVRPGYTQNMRRAFQETVQDELNLFLEARHQSMFRREAKKSGKKFFSAPKVYFDLSSRDVLGQELIIGMWLWELLAAVEQNDPAALARAEELNIDPKRVARRLLWINFWTTDGHRHFRADLHPDNVILTQNSKLIFIDFSSVGALSQEKRKAVQHTLLAAWNRDPLEMAHESMVLLEPLPPIDIIEFSRDLEAAYWYFLYGLESKHVQWWERTSARLWLGFVRVAREHNIVMNIHVLRMIRSNLLHDTIAARLSPGIDHVKQYQKFHAYRARKARNRIEKRVIRQALGGLDDRAYLQAERITETSLRLFRQLDRFLSKPVMKFSMVLGKSVYSVSTLFRLLGHLVVLAVVATVILYGWDWWTQRELSQLSAVVSRVLTNRFVQIAALVLVITNFRAMLFRMSDKEI